MARLANKVVLITGASRGIGAACATLFVQEGATTILADILDEEGQTLARSIGGYYEHLDVCQEDEWKALIHRIEKQYGKLDVLVNNAGIIGIGEAFGAQDPEYTSYSTWQKIHAVNADSVFLGCKYGIQLMKKTGGSIINMSSRSGVVGIPHACAYASSKASIRNHTKSVALYCAEQKYNIRCNSIHPGAILTPLWDAMLGETEQARAKAKADIASGIPLGHMGEPMDVAQLALYLASDESKYMTGSELTLDGGILAGSSAAPQK